MTVLNFIFGVPSLTYCFTELLYLLNLDYLEFGYKVANRFTVRIIHGISALIGIGIMVAWIVLSKNWILNDIICLSIVITFVRVLKF